MRPTYAREAIGELKSEIGTSGAIAHLAAGTGILTGQLRRAGLQVIAVEPASEVLGQLHRSLSSVPVLRAVAEDLPFARASLDGLVVGAAFHRFDAPAALAEAARVLRSGGVLALVWNRCDASVDWIRAYDGVVTSEGRDGRAHDAGSDWEELVAATEAFGDLRRGAHANPHPSSPSALMDRAASTGFLADAGPDTKARVLERVRELTATHPDLAGRDTFDLPWRTETYLWRRSA